MTWRVVLIACLALIVALGIRWLMPTDRSATPPITMPDTQFDYTLSDYSARFRDEQDRVELTLSGPRLEHVWAERIARLRSPEFHIEPEAADWHGTSDGGRVIRDDAVLVLEGNVTLTHRGERGDIEVKTERLRYDRRARTITSDTRVTMTQAESLLQSGGLRIELDNNLLELTDGVQGELEPAVASRGRDPGAPDRSDDPGPEQ
ncbi:MULTISPECIES: LPS export ABC transporter periplasmic protein LptC [unclassified Wenzhouxiangella]|uniref:LPS export ABC transporter periplasmic protein LptC n=1 Tax=unclassified Wenzhouxiangella TaxID=2613841 RepID=UPI0015F28471|nr:MULTISPECIES: LPS export ABC transporter periplasmic protein LptC [unclassified Wenzhouxiangella]